MRAHLAFLLLLAIAAPLTIAFCWREVIASLGDDSVSYLALARHYSPFTSDPLTTPWVKFHGHFAPLFPLLLAFTGGADNLLAAHLAVGACAVAAIFFVYRYAALRLASTTAGALLTLAFLLTPGAWISILGILSEPLYLALSLAAIVFHARHVHDADAGKAALLAFGLLLAASYLTRVAGVALIAAYALHAVVRAAAGRRLPAASALIPLVVWFLLSALWLALRPQPDVDNYRLTLRLVLERWLSDPAIVAASWDALFGGWVASFAGDSEAGLAMRLAFGLLGFLGLAGAVLAARKNRLDAWYVLATLAMIFLWVFPEAIARRLLYPVVPLLLVFAAEALMAATRLKRGIDGRRVLLPAFALFAVLVLPATILVAQKALDDKPLFPGSSYSLASITDYYTTVNVPRARAIAGEHAAVLAGLESLQRATPPGARVMWMRPEYVAVVGKRSAVAWYLSWDRGTLASAIHDSGANFLVVSRLYKNDLAGVTGDAFASIVDAPPAYLHPTLIIANPANRDMEFVLLEVDREALDRVFSGKGTPRA